MPSSIQPPKVATKAARSGAESWRIHKPLAGDRSSTSGVCGESIAIPLYSSMIITYPDDFPSGAKLGGNWTSAPRSPPACVGPKTRGEAQRPFLLGTRRRQNAETVAGPHCLPIETSLRALQLIPNSSQLCIWLGVCRLAPSAATRRLDTNPVTLAHLNTALRGKNLCRLFVVNQRRASASSRHASGKPIGLELPSFRK